MGNLTKAEILVKEAAGWRIRDLFQFGQRVSYRALELERQSLCSLMEDPSQIKQIEDHQYLAIVYGNLMQGDIFSENEDIYNAVSITLYLIYKSIYESNPDRSSRVSLFRFKFSTEYEYYKSVYSLMAHADGREVYSDYTEPFFMAQRCAAEHNLELMMMYDMFEEPAIGMEDTDLKRIFEETCSNYTISYDSKIMIMKSGEKLSRKIFEYLKSKIDNDDWSF